MAIQTGPRYALIQKRSWCRIPWPDSRRKRKTIAKAIAELEASRWEYDKPFKIKGKFIEVSNMLILDKHLTNCAKLLFCFILIVRELAGGVCVTRFSELHKMFRLGFNTVKRGMVALQAGKWLYSRQENKHAPIRIWTEFPLRKPLAVFNAMVNDGEQAEHTQSADGKADNRRQGTSLAERLVLGALTLIVNSDYYDDHYTPKFFPDWGPDHQMHFDRLYHREVVAIEYNGLQHYQATEWFDADVVAQQQWCDKFKSKICKINNVKLIVLIYGLLCRKIKKAVEVTCSA